MKALKPSGDEVLRTGHPQQWMGGPGPGLDRWAHDADARPSAYPADTTGGGGVQPCVVSNGGTTDFERARVSANASPLIGNFQNWEIGGWKNVSGGPYSRGFVFFHGWEGGSGPTDCEPDFRPFVANTYGTFASYSIGSGWEVN